MKALFLIFHGFDPANGISKKIHYQVEALKENGVKTQLCFLSEENGKRRMVDKTIIADYGNGLKGKIYKRLEYRSIVRYVRENRIDFVYIRSYHNANPFTIGMLRQLKKSGCRIVMEIPTYPYDQEYITPFMKMELFTDRCFRKKMAHLFDKIITFSDKKVIFGTETLQISNGINFNALQLKKRQNDTSHELHLIGVAEIHYWHGYDRLIQGLAAYYKQPQNYKIYFHLVGQFSGPHERKEIMFPIEDNQLGQYIIFHGRQYGSALDHLFDQCDLGIGSLGRHRSGIDQIKTLKNREYAARGIPFIYSETDADFDNMPYILKIPADESPVDLQSVLRFFYSLHQTPAEIRQSVTDLSWKEQMKRVLQAIE